MHTRTLTVFAVLALVVGVAFLGAHGVRAQTYATSTGTSGATTSTDMGTVNGTTNSTTNSTLTPGAPNTGAGGDAATNLALLLGSGLIAVGGMTYLARSFYVS